MKDRYEEKKKKRRHQSPIVHEKKKCRRKDRALDRSPIYEHKDGRNDKKPANLGSRHIKSEPMSDEERHRRHKHSHRPPKEEPRERSRWENEEDSPPNDRVNNDRGRRGRSGERLIRAMKGETEEEEHEWGSKGGPGLKKMQENNAKPDFGLSGKLTEETNMFNGVVIKYSEPAEARKPKRRWRLYPFKGDEGLPTLFIHRQSAYLIGRDRKVADIPIDHPSCSKQHAAFQYRVVSYKREDGTKGQRIKPYIIDLESANGTYVNNTRIDPRKYVELFEKDVIKFAYSSREYVLLHEHSAVGEDEVSE